jgi:hypothetical protein
MYGYESPEVPLKSSTPMHSNKTEKYNLPIKNWSLKPKDK